LPQRCYHDGVVDSRRRRANVAKSYQEMVAEAKAETEQTDADTVHGALEAGDDVTVVDVREPAEWEAGHIKGAKPVPRGLLEYKAADELPDKDARIVVHCAVGGRGALAAKALKEMGYTNVANMDGGMNDWQEKGYETE
jgi:phage shock protein E